MRVRALIVQCLFETHSSSFEWGARKVTQLNFEKRIAVFLSLRGWISMESNLHWNHGSKSGLFFSFTKRHLIESCYEIYPFIWWLCHKFPFKNFKPTCHLYHQEALFQINHRWCASGFGYQIHNLHAAQVAANHSPNKLANVISDLRCELRKCVLLACSHLG